jgi:cyclopropane-fatty-acyl-phospholipid synthase
MTEAVLTAATVLETDGVPLVLKPVLRRLARLPVGALTVDLPGGGYVRVRGHQPGPEASLRLLRLRAARRFLLGGALGFGEAFVDGDWDTPDLTQLLSYFLANQREVSFEPPTGFGWVPRLAHALNRNSKGGSKRNIASHYDLGNAFYALWLDRTMTYSAAVFDETDDLEAAQRAKYQRMADLAGIRPGDRVLEIGCGWGGFAEYAARERGAEVLGITLSAEQLSYAEARLHAAGLSERARFRLQDYRDTDGVFDRIVSIEMLEAVGEAYWPTYFQTIRRLLVPGGGAALQGIVIEDHRYPEYRATPDFIQTHIFPGGMLPSPAILAEQFMRAGLAPLADFGIGQDYARTLGRWRDQFLAAWDDISRLGFDDRFRRLWTYYLGYCEAGFRFGAIDVRQIGLRAV